MYQVSLKIFLFCFESGDRFSGVDKKVIGKGLCERGFWHDLFHGKDIDYNVMLQKITYIMVSGLQWGWGKTKR